MPPAQGAGDGILRLAAGSAEVDVAPIVGGSLAAFRLAGRDVLRPTPAAAIEAGNVRQFACYPLVPFSNRIRDGELALADGRRFRLTRNFGEHPHTIHGVGWQRSWHVARQATDELTLRFEHGAGSADASAWPFAFRASQGFALRVDARSAMLAMSLTIENTGTRSFPFGLGWHPFFSRAPRTRLQFTAAGVWHTDETRIPVRRESIDGPGAAGMRFGTAREIGDSDLDHVYTGWPGRARLDGAGLVIDILADRALDHLVVYVPAGRDFLAIEPVTHMTDAFNRDAAGDEATGTRHLPPGGAWCGTMRIVATLAPAP